MVRIICIMICCLSILNAKTIKKDSRLYEMAVRIRDNANSSPYAKGEHFQIFNYIAVNGYDYKFYFYKDLKKGYFNADIIKTVIIKRVEGWKRFKEELLRSSKISNQNKSRIRLYSFFKENFIQPYNKFFIKAIRGNDINNYIKILISAVDENDLRGFDDIINHCLFFHRSWGCNLFSSMIKYIISHKKQILYYRTVMRLLSICSSRLAINVLINNLGDGRMMTSEFIQSKMTIGQYSLFLLKKKTNKNFGYSYKAWNIWWKTARSSWQH